MIGKMDSYIDRCIDKHTDRQEERQPFSYVKFDR